MDNNCDIEEKPDAKQAEIEILLVEEESKGETEGHTEMLYGITDTPPVHTSIFLGLQHFLAMFIGNLTSPLILSDAMCMGEDPAVKVELFGVQFFISGFITLAQVLLGVRLPIIQGSTFCLLLPVLSFLQMPKNQCPIIKESCWSVFNVTNGTNCIEKESFEYEQIWKSRLVTIQGSIMVASLVEILMGLTGVVGFLIQFIGPLTICPTLALVGLSLFPTAAEFGGQNWPICIMTLVVLVLFSQYLFSVSFPIPICTPKKGCAVTRFPVFKSYPVILAILVSWLICWLLTVTNAIPADSNHWAYTARTDINTRLLTEAPWFNFFWPGKYGMPRVEISLVIGLVAGLVTSVIESVGDYHACARMCGIANPPKHALNRGIFMEGFGCFVAGLFGTGGGLTSYSQNVGLIGLTKVASRVVALYAAGFMVFVGIFNKFGALFVTVPAPVIGGAFMVLFGMIAAIALSNLQFVNLNSSRNLFVLGFSLFMGITVSEWMKAKMHTINTGAEILDGILSLLLSTSMFVGGSLAFFLDNTLPGTKKDRGIIDSQGEGTSEATSDLDEGESTQTEHDHIYGLPLCMRNLDRVKLFSYLPLCPAFYKAGIDNIVHSPIEIESDKVIGDVV